MISGTDSGFESEFGKPIYANQFGTGFSVNTVNVITQIHTFTSTSQQMIALVLPSCRNDGGALYSQCTCHIQNTSTSQQLHVFY